MSRVPREDAIVQLSIRKDGFSNVCDTDVVITEWPCPATEWPCPDPQNRPQNCMVEAFAYPNPDVVRGPYPEPLSEMLSPTTRELVLDFLNEEDQNEIARL